ncbi:MAG TPA: hypothetical protein VFX48_05615 [Saprospiraceae bacterium]|nr:hypothetical protein [Saprospiraceae bacterium]
MKHITFLFALGALLFASCQKEESENTNLDTGVVTEEISLDELLLTETFPMPDVNDELVSSLDPRDGRKFRRIPLDKLPEIITDFIAATDPTGKLLAAFKVRGGNILVYVKAEDGSVSVYVFDQDGNFIKTVEPKKGHGPKHPGKRLSLIELADLPAAITDYVESNYAGAELKKAGQTENGSYLVFMFWNGSRKLLLFDPNGQFVKEIR